eukprot:m.27547 g.27547  ORF g.27547 m.27547 type:complete len:412 (-) comp5953_c0_seq1:1086-2321(-)
MVLSPKQKEEAYNSIIGFLGSEGHDDAAKIVAKAVGVDMESFDSKKFSSLLEKKLTSVVRLQKKVLTLEEQLKDATEELAHPSQKKTTGDPADWTPHAPPKHECIGHRSPITSVAFHPSFTQIASGSEDATIKLWDYERGEFEQTLKGHTKAVNDVCFNKDGSLIASASSDSTVKLWNTSSYSCTKTLQGHEHTVSSVSFDSSDEVVLSASRDKTIRIFQVATGICSKVLLGHSDWVRQALFSPDGNLIISCSSDHSVRVWDRKQGECKHALTGHEHVVEGIAIAPTAANERILSCLYPEGMHPSVSNVVFCASVSRDKTVIVWEVVSGQKLCQLIGHDNWVRGAVWHPLGKSLFTCSDDKSIIIWDMATKKKRKAIKGHKHFVSAIAAHPKCHYVATGSVDLKLNIWECS